MDDLLTWLQNYYKSLCDGLWEHQYGFKIDNVDNPGWRLDFDLTYTEMEDVPFSYVRIDRSEHDWVHCKVDEKVFQGNGGPQNLVEILVIFRNWVETSRRI